MVSGSQLQVAKLAQMCPAAPSSVLRCPAVHSGNPCQNIGQNIGQNPGVKTRVKTGLLSSTQRHQTVPTSAF